MTELATWAGNYRFTARRVVEARTVGDVRRAVAAGGRVRALGTRHSFHDLAENGATLVTVTGIPPEPVLDEAARTVTVGGGTTYGQLATWLQERGWALANLASLPHISIAGAIATGTHGSGSGNQVLSAAVAGLDYVAAGGEVRRAERSEPDFAGLAVGLGAFGIVVRVTVDIEPTYQVRQDVYAGLTWDRLLASLPGVLAAGYSVSVFTDWGAGSVQAWVKRRVAGPAGPALDDAVPEELFGARRDRGPARLVDAPVDNLTEHGAPGPWSERLPHFRIDSVPSNGNEIQSEYFVSAEHGPAAVEAVHRLTRLVTPLLLVSEIRIIAPDQLWLSGAYGRPTVALHFTWRNLPEQVDAVLPHVEAALAPYDARPHWGKVTHVGASQLARLYPRLADARALFERLDPDGQFSASRLERLGVREGHPDR